MAGLQAGEADVGVGDDRRWYASCAICVGALATTTAYAGIATVRPDLPALADGPAVLVVGFGCLAVAGMLTTARRRNASARGKAVASTREMPSPKLGEDAMAPSRDDRPMSAGASEVAEAAIAACISRILVPASPGGRTLEAAALARRLAGRGESTILVDFDGGGTAGEFGLMGVESVAHIAASPATFAHSIQRDRSGRAHVMAAHAGRAVIEPDAAVAAMASVLATLEEVYARTVVILPSEMEEIDVLVHADTALVLPQRSENGFAQKHLTGYGRADLIVMADDARDPSIGGSSRTASFRQVRG